MGDGAPLSAVRGSIAYTWSASCGGSHGLAVLPARQQLRRLEEGLGVLLPHVRRAAAAAPTAPTAPAAWTVRRVAVLEEGPDAAEHAALGGAARHVLVEALQLPEMFAHSGTGHDGVRQWKQWMSDALNTSFGIAPNRLIAALSTSSADAAAPASGVASCDTSAFTASRSSSFLMARRSPV